MKIVTSRGMIPSLSHFDGKLLMVTLSIKVKSFLAGPVTINVPTNLISSLNGQQWNKFHKAPSYLNKDRVHPTKGMDMRVRVMHIGLGDANTRTRGSFIFLQTFR